MSGEKIFGDDGSEEEDIQEPEVVEDDEDIVEVSSDDSDMPVPDDENTLVRPVEDIDAVIDVYNQFETIKEELLDSQSDITKIGSNYHINKSGWRKISTAFNLSLEMLKSHRVVEDGVVKYVVTARAVAPNGKSTTGSGVCGSNESNFMEKLVDKGAGREKAEQEADDPDSVLLVDGWYRELKNPREVNDHNLMATAETRAKNRAISDLVGGGEVSAEEMGAKKKKDILEG